MPRRRQPARAASAGRLNNQTTLMFSNGAHITKPSIALPTKQTVTVVIPQRRKQFLKEVRIPSPPSPEDTPKDPSRGSVEAEKSKSSEAETEAKAARISNAQIKQYWDSHEASRLAPRVHQEGYSVSEKILREFDLSSQYGPCVGMSRLKRWKRADSLGLKPPIEVLAVLTKAEGTSMMSCLDELLERCGDN